MAGQAASDASIQTCVAIVGVTIPEGSSLLLRVPRYFCADILLITLNIPRNPTKTPIVSCTILKRVTLVAQNTPGCGVQGIRKLGMHQVVLLLRTTPSALSPRL